MYEIYSYILLNNQNNNAEMKFGPILSIQSGV